MAKPSMKNAAPPPAPDDDTEDQTGAGGGAGGGEDDDQGEGEDSGPTVIATIMDNHDGTYTLVHGDEQESGADEDEGAEGGESEGGPEGEEGDENAAGAGAGGGEEGEEGAGAEGEEEGPEQEHFDNPGELLKAVLDILNEAEANNGSGEHAFAAGFDESHNPTPKS